MTPEEQQAEAIAVALARRQPWYAKPYAYACTAALALGLSVLCPRLPPAYRGVCEFAHDVAHQLVEKGPVPPSGAVGDEAAASLTTSQATDAGAVDGG